MATRVVYGTSAEDGLTAASGVYATARAMTSPSLIGSLRVENSFDTISTYTCSQGFIGFDTSGFSGLSSATLTLDSSNSGVVDADTLEARLFDWGATVTTGDAIAGASLSAQTLLASLALSSFVGGYINLTNSGSNLLNNINTSGFTRCILCTTGQTNGTTPTGLNKTSPDTSIPKLTIVDTSTQSSQTINAGTTSFTPVVTGVHDLDLWSGASKVATAAAAKSGAGGGSYKFAQFTVPSLSAITVQVAAAQTTNGSVGNDTWFNSSSAPDPLAKGAQGVSATAANAGGLSSSGRGVLGFDGGTGAAGQGGGGSRGGSSGGTSAGTAAVGVNGATGSGSAAGAAQTAPTGGGNSGIGGAGGGGAAGAGSVPGGAGGGGGSSSGANGDGAAGKMIVYWYVTAAAAFIAKSYISSQAVKRASSW